MLYKVDCVLLFVFQTFVCIFFCLLLSFYYHFVFLVCVFVNSFSRFSSADVEECIAAVRKLLESCLIILNALLYVNLQKPKHDKSLIK